MSDKCCYGCGNDVKFTFKNGKKCCSENRCKCPVISAKISDSNRTRTPPSGHKLPTKECPSCHKEFSGGNFEKHLKACIGEGKKKVHTCKVCEKEFTSYGNPKTCSKVCRNAWLKTKTANMYATGEKVPVGYTKKTCYYESETHGKIKLMSSYELDTCFILDKWLSSGRIKFWEYTKDRFSYYDADKKRRTYFPDFKVFLEDSVYYIETKGFEIDNDSYKWNAVKQQGHTLEVWFGDIISQHKDNKD